MSELFGVRATKEANNGKQDIKWKQVNPLKKKRRKVRKFYRILVEPRLIPAGLPFVSRIFRFSKGIWGFLKMRFCSFWSSFLCCERCFEAPKLIPNNFGFLLFIFTKLPNRHFVEALLFLFSDFYPAKKNLENRRNVL